MPSDSTDLSEDYPRNLGAAELVCMCARDIGNAELWTEFLRRFTPRIRSFVRKTLRRFQNHSARMPENFVSGVNEEHDLIQNTILRLVEHDCALMKRITCVREEEFVAYLAVLADSVVRDSFRWVKAVKRPSDQSSCPESFLDMARPESRNGARQGEPDAERQVLANEVWKISLRLIENLSGLSRTRDRRIFHLYFSKGASVQQIAQMKAIGLSKTAVENVLNRLKDRVRAVVASHSTGERKR